MGVHHSDHHHEYPDHLHNAGHLPGPAIHQVLQAEHQGAQPLLHPYRGAVCVPLQLPQAQCPLLTATPVCAAPWVRRCAPPPPAPPPPLCPPAPPCLAQTLAVSVSSPSPSLV